MGFISLNNIFSARVNWQKSTLVNFKIDGQVDIWQVNVSENLHLINNFLAVLSPDEILRANRYLRRKDRDRFVISRGALRHILAGYLVVQPAEIRFELESNKKPFVVYPAEKILKYNLSDSEDYVLIAVAGSAVGIDIEYIKPKFYYDSILPLNFNQREVDYIQQEDSSFRFFTLWTRKEAILKATGIGLTDHLKQIPSLDGKFTVDGDLLATGNDWQLMSFVSAPDYIATIAVDPKIKAYNFYGFNSGEFFN